LFNSPGDALRAGEANRQEGDRHLKISIFYSLGIYYGTLRPFFVFGFCCSIFFFGD
jgi:hypothetical protein